MFVLLLTKSFCPRGSGGRFYAMCRTLSQALVRVRARIKFKTKETFKHTPHLERLETFKTNN